MNRGPGRRYLGISLDGIQLANWPKVINDCDCMCHQNITFLMVSWLFSLYDTDNKRLRQYMNHGSYATWVSFRLKLPDTRLLFSCLFWLITKNTSKLSIGHSVGIHRSLVSFLTKWSRWLPDTVSSLSTGHKSICIKPQQKIAKHTFSANFIYNLNAFWMCYRNWYQDWEHCGVTNDLGNSPQPEGEALNMLKAC